MRDAEHRSRVFDAASMIGGWDAAKQQFYLASSDGNYLFHPFLEVQVRYVVNSRDDAKNGGNNDTQEGFEIRRAKFGADGNIFNKDFLYKVTWQDAINGGTPNLEYAYGQYTFMHNASGTSADLAARLGQYKDILYKEEVVGDTSQLLAERSLVNALIGSGSAGPLVQGLDLMLLGGNNPLHAEVAFVDGDRSGNTDFTDTVFATNFGVEGRVDWKVFGDWADTTDFTGKNFGKHDLLDFGAGADFSQGDNNNISRFIVDAQYMTAQRFSLYGAVLADTVDFRNMGGPSNRTDYGGQIEAGYFITRAWQPVARYSITRLDSDFAIGGENTFQEIAIGVNYYMGKDGSLGNHAKLTLDLNYLPEGSPAVPGLDYLASPGHNQFVLRAQFQLWL